jgi:predicted HD phosphohydrolase
MTFFKYIKNDRRYFKRNIAFFRKCIKKINEAKKFTLLRFHKNAIMLRKYDDDGKVPNIKMKKIDDYRNLINSQLIETII